jgi:hypothetical protein
MNRFYSYIYFIIYKSIKESGGIDPPFSSVAILTYFETMFGLIVLGILEIISRREFVFLNKEYFFFTILLLFVINTFFFFYKNKHIQVISNSEFLHKESHIKTWHILGAMFFILFLLVIISIVRIEIFR